MFPPTPTFIPIPAVMPVTVDSSQWRIWKFTDEAIMLWNQSNRWQLAVVFQIGVIAAIIIGFVFFAMRISKAMTDSGDL